MATWSRQKGWKNSISSIADKTKAVNRAITPVGPSLFQLTLGWSTELKKTIFKTIEPGGGGERL